MDEEDIERMFMENLERLNGRQDEMCENELKIHELVKKTIETPSEVIPVPTELIISTKSAKCSLSEEQLNIHLGRVVTYLSRCIINSYFDKNKRYPIRGIVVDNLIIRYDDVFVKKYKRPYIKYNEIQVNPFIREECDMFLDNLSEIEGLMEKKRGRQKDRNEETKFYNCCSIIVKPSKLMKNINVKLFNNGRITLTGSKEEDDGYQACLILLNELKERRDLFLGITDNIYNELKINNYGVTMINSNYRLNFKIDLTLLLNAFTTSEPLVFTKFNPDDYRGLIIGYFWNESKGENQDGICRCETRCKKKKIMTATDCKKVTISLFKTGSVIITGGNTVEQINGAYDFINEKLRIYYKRIVKLSVSDFMEKNDTDDYDIDEIRKIVEEESKQIDLEIKEYEEQKDKKNKKQKKRTLQENTV